MTASNPLPPGPGLLGAMQLGQQAQRVHVGIWYILRAQRGSHRITYFKAQVYPIYLHGPFGRGVEGNVREHDFVCIGFRAAGGWMVDENTAITCRNQC